jgi:transposase
MDHIGIDLGGKESQVCIRSAEGVVKWEGRWATSEIGAYVKELPRSRMVLETCAEAFAVADAIVAAGHEVRVVPCSLVRSLGVGARGVKTDEKDARALSEVSCRVDLPSVHMPSSTARQWKTLCGTREALVESRTRLVNTVKGWLRTQTQRVKSGTTATLPQRVRDRYEMAGLTVPSSIARQLEAIAELSDQIADADAELDEVSAADPVCRRLMTVPGVGPVTAIRFVAAIDDVSRFGGAHALESYLGLVPGEYSSSERQRRTGITKAGSAKLRWALVQASWSARRCRPRDPMVVWATQVEQRRGRRVAMVALARKIAGILYAVWRDGSEYRIAA